MKSAFTPWYKRGHRRYGLIELWGVYRYLQRLAEA
jgi:hypothetical protein